MLASNDEQWSNNCLLQICVILLSLLLVYDVFFVFITPFFTKVCPFLFSGSFVFDIECQEL